MYVTDEQLQKRLGHESNIAVPFAANDSLSSIKTPEVKIINTSTKERVKAANHLTKDEKVLAGALSKFDTQKNVAEVFDVTQGAVSRMSRSLNGNGSVDKERQEKVDRIVDNKREQIAQDATDRLMDALGIVKDKINNEDAESAANIAVKMSGVIKDMRGSDADKPQMINKVMIYAPGVKEDTSKFEVIDVK